MTYNKPQDVTYTDMCIYIDENVYKSSHNEYLVYEYLYHIVLMLARKASLFSHNKYYDGFAIFGATRIYRRLTNKKQFEFDSEGIPRMHKIKSVLNYAKTILYPLKVDFEQEEYCQNLSKEAYAEAEYNYNNVIKSSLNDINIVDFSYTMQDVGKTCEKFLSTIPYSKDSKEWMNIYVSVMLTFMNYVTLRNKFVRRIEHLQSTLRLKDTHIEGFFKDERNSAPILFHLDSSMSNYITVLARQLKHIVAKDLSSILNTDVSYDYQLMDIAKELSDIGGSNED